MPMYLGSTLITFALQWAGFAVAFGLQTEKFYDILGGANYLALAAYSACLGSAGWASDSRRIAATIIFVCSRGWLLGFLAWRAHDRQGDARFDKIKGNAGAFATAWTVQGVWVLLVSLPLLYINASPASEARTLAGRDLLLLAAFGLGVVIEIVADVQKALWVKSGRQGGFCTRGLWSFSRHPNYFGEMLQWWACWLLAYASGPGVTDWCWWATGLSPLFTMHVLLNIPATGVCQANGKSLKRYYDRFPETYATYRASTSMLLPMVGYQYVPMFLKRTVLLDRECYEYRPRPEGTVHTSTRSAKVD